MVVLVLRRIDFEGVLRVLGDMRYEMGVSFSWVYQSIAGIYLNTMYSCRLMVL